MITSSPRARLLAIGLAAVTAALAAGGCSDPSDKKADVSSGVSTTLVAPAAPEPGQPATTTSTAAAAPSTTRAPATTRPPAASDKIVVAPDGLGVVSFGEPADAAIAKLKAKLGPPLSDGPPPNPCSPEVTRNVQWDGLAANFSSTFIGYHTGGRQQMPRYRTEAGIGLDSTVAQLKVAYGSKVRLEAGDGNPAFTVALPKGTLRGTTTGPQDDDFVFALFAGTWCD